MMSGVVLVFMALGCSEEKYVPTGPVREVEIEPDRWLGVESRPGRVWMRFAWGGEIVTWDGKGSDLGELEIPICLRKKENDLYMVTFDREDLEAIKLNYYSLRGGARFFEEIRPSDFPKAIATQNMWLQSHSRFLTGLNGKVDLWELTRKLDATDLYFRKTITSLIWVALETGKSISEVEQMDSELINSITKEYKRKYHPVALPALVRPGNGGNP